MDDWQEEDYHIPKPAHKAGQGVPQTDSMSVSILWSSVSPLCERGDFALKEHVLFFRKQLITDAKGTEPQNL